MKKKEKKKGKINLYYLIYIFFFSIYFNLLLLLFKYFKMYVNTVTCTRSVMPAHANMPRDRWKCSCRTMYPRNGVATILENVNRFGTVKIFSF